MRGGIERAGGRGRASRAGALTFEGGSVLVGAEGVRDLGRRGNPPDLL